MKKDILLTVIILAILVVVICFTPVYDLLFPFANPVHLFDIENPNEIYMISIFPDSHNYGLHPLSETNKGTYYISNSPENLDKYVGKKVKIMGRFVMTKYYFKAPNNTKETFAGNSEAVALTSIRLAQ